MAGQPFQIVEELPDRPETRPVSDTVHDAATSALLLALKALSQRALTAIPVLFTLLSFGAAFVLWWLTPDPNTNQIVSLTIFGLLVLAGNWMVLIRRGK